LDHRTRSIPYAGPTMSTSVHALNDLQRSDLSFVRKDVYDHRATLDTYLKGSQITDSVSNPLWLHRDKRRFLGDIGGPFSTRKYEFVSEIPPTISLSRTDRTDAIPDSVYWDGSRIHQYIFTGPCLPIAPNYMQFPPLNFSSNDTLEEKGATAIARCSPSNPTVDLSVAVGEVVKEGIPHLVGSVLGAWKGMSNRDRRKAIGDEYLNWEFGWVPLVSDLKKLSKSILNADKIVNDYTRNSGKMVRRKYSFPVETETSIDLIDWNTSPWVPSMSTAHLDFLNLNKGQVLRSSSRTKRQWFSGAFTYYVPPPDGLRNKLARDVILARKLLGISLTPDVLWNLAPWSWAFDWFGNTGDVISNWTAWAIDNQVLLYGYMMEHIVHTYTYTFVGKTGFYQSDARPVSVTLRSESKIRIQASPYGFGLSFDDLSLRQKAIVAALGLTRGK